MNDMHSEYPERTPRRAAGAPAGAGDPGAGAPFRGPGHDAGEPHFADSGQGAAETGYGDRWDEGEVYEEDHDEGPAGRLLTSPGAPTHLRKRRRRRRNIVMLVVLGVFALAITGIVVFLQGLLGPVEKDDYTGAGDGEVTFTVEQGWGPLQIGRALEEQDIVASQQLFLEAIQEVESDSKVIHPGDYELKYRMPALSAAGIMVGTGGERVSYVAIRQNVRTDAVFEEINKATGIPISELEQLSAQPEKFGLEPPVRNLEGFLHPGEYRFPVDTDAAGVLQLMVDATLKELTDQGVTDPTEQYRILKIASILQAEARPDDYPVVAGALENRLAPGNTETGGLLQVDSAVIYGLKRYSLQFTTDEKNDAENRYNTYVHPGLPPTPIGSPADTAIEAAIAPDENDYYYWVTVDTTTGETKFAETYEEHRVNQNEFRAWCEANPDICK